MMHPDKADELYEMLMVVDERRRNEKRHLFRCFALGMAISFLIILFSAGEIAWVNVGIAVAAYALSFFLWRKPTLAKTFDNLKKKADKHMEEYYSYSERERIRLGTDFDPDVGEFKGER